MLAGDLSQWNAKTFPLPVPRTPISGARFPRGGLAAELLAVSRAAAIVLSAEAEHVRTESAGHERQEHSPPHQRSPVFS